MNKGNENLNGNNRETYKESFRISRKTILAVGLGVIYLVSPMDLVPDILPVMGRIDDRVVLIGMCKLICKDLERYINWRTERNREIMLSESANENGTGSEMTHMGKDKGGGAYDEIAVCKAGNA